MARLFTRIGKRNDRKRVLVELLPKPSESREDLVVGPYDYSFEDTLRSQFRVCLVPSQSLTHNIQKVAE